MPALEVDLGRGEPPALAVLVRPRMTHGPMPVGVGRAATSTSNTCTTGPPRTHRSPSVTDSVPPGTSTCTCSPTRPRRCATAAAAHAPVPHDSVSPAPRSQTRIASRSGPAWRHELDVRAAREARGRVPVTGRASRPARSPDRRRAARGAGCPSRPRRPGTPPRRRPSRSNGESASTGMRAGSNVAGPMSTSAPTTAPVAFEVNGAAAGRGVDREFVAAREPGAGCDPREAADAVAAHLGAPRRRSTASSRSRRRRGRADRDESVGTDTAMPVAQRRDWCGVERAAGRRARAARGSRCRWRGVWREIQHTGWWIEGMGQASGGDGTRPGCQDAGARVREFLGRHPLDAGVAAEPHPLAARELAGAPHRRSKAASALGSSPSQVREHLAVADRLRGRWAMPAGRAGERAHFVDEPARRASPRTAARSVRRARREAASSPTSVTGSSGGRTSSDAGAERRERPAGRFDHFERAHDPAAVVGFDRGPRPRDRAYASARTQPRGRRRRRLRRGARHASAGPAPGISSSSTTARTYRPVPPTSSARLPRASMRRSPRRELPGSARPTTLRRIGDVDEVVPDLGPSSSASAWRCRCPSLDTPASSRARRSRRRPWRRARSSASADLPVAVGPTSAR